MCCECVANSHIFHQTCDPSSLCPFMQHPHLNNIASYLSLCEEVFGIAGATVAELVNETNVLLMCCYCVANVLLNYHIFYQVNETNAPTP